MSPTARALRALDLLQARPGITAAEIADRLGVTERAARRYVAILREADIPIESTRGIYGGYRLGRGVRLPPVLFTQEEALGLVMAVLDSHLTGEEAGEETVASALSKVISALPEKVGREAAELRAHASAAPSRRQGRPDPLVTSTIVAARAAERSLTITYRSAKGNEWQVLVDPWALVVRFGRWYLVCHDHRADGVRTYRVDRIGSAEVSDQSFDMPTGFDPGAALEEHLGSGWEYATRVRFLAPIEQVSHWIRGPMGRLEADGDECVLTGTTENPAMYAQEWLSTVPYPFRIEHGPELRAAAAELANRMHAAVADPST